MADKRGPQIEEPDEPWWGEAEEGEYPLRKPEVFDPADPAMEAWVNDRLNEPAEAEFLARQSSGEWSDRFRLRLRRAQLERLLQTRDVDRLVALTSDEKLRRLYFEQALRRRGRPSMRSKETENIVLADKDVDRVLDLWREHYGKTRGVLDAAQALVLRRYNRLGLKVPPERLKKYRRRGS